MREAKDKTILCLPFFLLLNQIKNNLPKGLASLFNIQQQQTCCLFFQAEADTNDKEILKNIHCVKS